ncbi:MAG: hypothetical protein L0177_16175 [Chloroflexi bacterium]|nr:hypothetical protein [Chloroflexota bacterium]
MARKRIGKLTPRYSFILNSYVNERLSKCPKCRKLTHLRKFALFIHIDEWGPMVMGKTCRYCTPCELIVAHQHELESDLAISFSETAPEMIGNDYLVLGTVDMKVWKRGLAGEEVQFREMLNHMADFKKFLELKVEPGGWYPIDENPKKPSAKKLPD